MLLRFLKALSSLDNNPDFAFFARTQDASLKLMDSYNKLRLFLSKTHFLPSPGEINVDALNKLDYLDLEISSRTEQIYS